jgi:hypothetical protein
MNISYSDQWFGRGNTDGSRRNSIFGEEPAEYELTAMGTTYYIDIIASFINYNPLLKKVRYSCKIFEEHCRQIVQSMMNDGTYYTYVVNGI